jgi:hypothetical protein
MEADLIALTILIVSVPVVGWSYAIIYTIKRRNKPKWY